MATDEGDMNIVEIVARARAERDGETPGIRLERGGERLERVVLERGQQGRVITRASPDRES